MKPPEFCRCEDAAEEVCDNLAPFKGLHPVEKCPTCGHLLRCHLGNYR